MGKLYLNLQSYFGPKTWWLEAKTHGDVKITRQLTIEILCGLETVKCVGFLCDNEKIVLNRLIGRPTPFYYQQSLYGEDRLWNKNLYIVEVEKNYIVKPYQANAWFEVSNT